jgi:GrpB-like predicted nucleotidyltransferase (UPF0157 family)
MADERDTPATPATQESSAEDLAAFEERMRAIHVTPLQPLTSRIVIAPYSAEWPRQYAELAAGIRSALGEKVLRLEHAGSTSVPGLSAKPHIDIVLVVADPANEDSYVSPLIDIGYHLRVREPDWYQHRMLKYPSPEVNLHVFGPNCVEVARMLAMRDWLRRNADGRALYERTKRELAARDWTYMQQYADAKSVVVEDILSRALAALGSE